MADPEDEKSGCKITPVAGNDFRDFAKRFARSPEVGPIATALDKAPNGEFKDNDLRLYGLYGCDTLCAVVCLQPMASRTGDEHVVKLDSVVVHTRMRQRGFGGLLVTHAFADVAADPALDVARIYAHAVHPATVKLLARLGFGDPPPTGAPLSSIDLSEHGVAAFTEGCQNVVRRQEGYMKVQCSLCRQNSRRAQPWCVPDEDER